MKLDPQKLWDAACAVLLGECENGKNSTRLIAEMYEKGIDFEEFLEMLAECDYYSEYENKHELGIVFGEGNEFDVSKKTYKDGKLVLFWNEDPLDPYCSVLFAPGGIGNDTL